MKFLFTHPRHVALIYWGRETGRRSFEAEQLPAEYLYLSVVYFSDKGRYLGCFS